MSAGSPDACPAAASYRYLDGAAPADLAWEWLRRNPDYRRVPPESVVTAGDVTILDPAPAHCTARWGCLNMPDARQPWLEAPLLWSAEVDPSILNVLALPASDRVGPTFNLDTCSSMAMVVNGGGCQHVLLRAGAEAVRLDVLSGSLVDGPVSLVLSLAGMEENEAAVLALRRFLHLRRTGRFPAPSSPPRQRLQRQVQALRVHDALVAGASIRDVGIMLFGFERVRDEWVGEALKSQCRRLIALARETAAGGYRHLLSKAGSSHPVKCDG
jgi:hypothetical protein